MPRENIIDNIRDSIKTLTNSERKVADFIVKNPSEVTFDTINVLAQKVGTSTTTIMRLAAKLGYSGYSDFQHDIQKFVKDRDAPQARLISNLQNIEEDELWIQTVGYHINRLNQLMEQVDKDNLDKVVKFIEDSRKICCTCVRSGLPVGQYFSQNVNRIKGDCSLIVADVSDWVDEIISMDSRDLLVVVSFPRYAKRIDDFVRTAKKRGIKIVVITDKYSSPLVDYGDVVIPCDSDSLAFHNSPIAAAVTVDYIINALAIGDSHKDDGRLGKVDDILKSIDYHTK